MERKLSALFLALVLCLSAAGCRREEEDPAALIREMVLSYGKTQDPVAAEDSLKRLTASDPAQGAAWRQIMDYWQYTAEMPVNDRIPDGLPDTESLAVVILGFRLNPDGTMQDELLARLETGLAFAEKYPRARIVCTGGGTAENAPDKTEAGEMYAWLRENGVEESRLFAEDRSLTTGQNADYTYDLLRKTCPEVNAVAIVSSDYHIPWGSVLFQTKCILASPDAPAIRVISNAACHPVSHSDYPFRFQAAGILELAGMEKDAYAIYQGG